MRIWTRMRSSLAQRGVSTARVGHRATETRSELASSARRRAHQLTRALRPGPPLGSERWREIERPLSRATGTRSSSRWDSGDRCRCSDGGGDQGVLVVDQPCSEPVDSAEVHVIETVIGLGVEDQLENRPAMLAFRTA